MAVERDEAATNKYLVCAGFDGDAPVVIVDVEREVAMVVAVSYTHLTLPTIYSV